MRQVNLNVIKDNKAVTLIELMMVLSIIAIMLGIAAPTFFNYQHTLKLRSTSRELASDIRYTRQLAISKNTVYSLCFDSTNTSQYSIFNTNDCSGSAIKTVNIPQLYPGVVKTAGPTKLIFLTLGCVVTSGTTCAPTNVEFDLNDCTQLEITKGITRVNSTEKITVSGAGNVTIQYKTAACQ